MLSINFLDEPEHCADEDRQLSPRGDGLGLEAMLARIGVKPPLLECPPTSWCIGENDARL
jgi:hypothetical protein